MALPIGRQLLYDATGRRRPDADVLSEVGDAGLRTALLADAVHRRARETEPPSSPPGALLSYTEDQSDWTARLAELLTSLGWVVRAEPRRRAPMSVTEFEQGIANCRLFVAVLTPQYWHQKSWFYDEIQVAVSLPYVHTLAVTRSPGLVNGAEPAGVVRAPERPVAFHRLIRGDDPAALRDELTRNYRYEGGTLPAEAEQLIRREALAAASAKPPTHEHAGIVSALVEKAPWLGTLWLQLIDIRQRLGDAPGAIDAARRGARSAPIWEGREKLCEAEMSRLYDDGQFEEAFRAAVAAVRDFPRNWLARLVIGSLLDDLRRPWTGRSHLLLASTLPGRSAQVLNMLGVVYLHLGAFTRAEKCFRDALSEDPANTLARGNLALATHLPRGDGATAEEVPGPACGCTGCDSVFGDIGEAAACAGCAAPRTAGEPCPLCGEPAVAHLGSECPVCRTGKLVMRDHIRL